ncbi:MAG: hypothetical protein MUO22_03250 [Sedimentisphaerales bacterium]|nr:hypothetical protein [Sedimentisphaerales bacterium]
MIGLTLICAKTADADSPWSWDWDSCTLEGWISPMPDIIVTVEDGREETCGIGAALEPDATHVPTIKIGGQALDPGALVGGLFGSDLEMTGEIYVDIDRQTPFEFANYVELEIFDHDSYGRFLCYPYYGRGSIEDLGGGWYRHHLTNLGHWYGDFSPLDAGCFYLRYNEVDPLPVGEPPVIFDNLKIAPEADPIPVDIDIRPSCCPKPLSMRSKGILPVAILGTNGFDVNDIEPTSVVLNGVSAVRHCYRDAATSAEPCVCPDSVGPDGFIDLVLNFPTEDILGTLGVELNDGDEFELDLTGQLIDGTPIVGSDCVLIRDGTLY